MKKKSTSGNYLRLFRKSLWNMKEEITISLLIVIVLTVVLAAVFYWVESAAQPDVYDSPFSALAWAYSRYIESGDGVFSGDPVTPLGKTIAFMLGFVGLAVVVIPTGLISAGFVQAAEADKHEKKRLQDTMRIKENFYIDYEQVAHVDKRPAIFKRVSRLRRHLGLSEEAIVEAVSKDMGLRFIDIASSFPSIANGDDMAVEMFNVNRDYGYCQPARSSITIVSPNSAGMYGTSYAGYQMARIGRFNYVSNEFLNPASPSEDNRCPTDEVFDEILLNYPKYNHFINDILEVSDDDGWIFVINKNSHPKAPKMALYCFLKGDADFEKPITGGIDREGGDWLWSNDPSTNADSSVSDHKEFRRFIRDLWRTMGMDESVFAFNAQNQWSDHHIVRWLNARNKSNVVWIDFSNDFFVSKQGWECLVQLTRLINSHFETKQPFGINLLPDEHFPVFRGRETDQVRIVKQTADLLWLHFRPDVEAAQDKDVPLKDVDMYFSLDTSLGIEWMQSDIDNLQSASAGVGAFGPKNNHSLIEPSPKQLTLDQKGVGEFTIAGRIRNLLYDHKYRIDVFHVTGPCIITYEFLKPQQRYQDGKMTAYPFDPQKVGFNVETFQYPGLDEFNGREVIHLNELTYDGIIVDGQVCLKTAKTASHVTSIHTNPIEELQRNIK